MAHSIYAITVKKTGFVLYAGVTARMETRSAQHRNSSRVFKRLWWQLSMFEVASANNKPEAYAAEAWLIKKLKSSGECPLNLSRNRKAAFAKCGEIILSNQKPNRAWDLEIPQSAFCDMFALLRAKKLFFVESAGDRKRILLAAKCNEIKIKTLTREPLPGFEVRYL